MRKNYLLIILFFSVLGSFAQQKISLDGSIEAGLLEGEKGSAFQLGAMAGIRKNTWIVSLGSGLDYYAVRSIPVYLNLQKNILNKTKTPFVYLAGGYHFLWLSESFNEWRWWQNAESKGGLYYRAGIGYQWPALKGSSLFFSAGYSEKQYSETTTSTFPCLVAPCPEYKETISNRLRRLTITTGLRF